MAGRSCYTLARYLLWFQMRGKFPKARSEEPLPCLQFHHETPLLRQLAEVDMIYQTNKVINLRLAAPRLNGIILMPGETLSLWKLVGNPKGRSGYVPGMVLHSGQFHMEAGGGLCQLSNLLYWMSLHTPLSVVERYRHSYDVFPDSDRTQPFGSGATCVYPYRDLMIQNNTTLPFQLRMEVGETHLIGEWRSIEPAKFRYEIVEKDHHFTSEYWGGFTRHNTLFRRHFSPDGRFLKEEYLTENHAVMMYSPLLETKESSSRR